MLERENMSEKQALIERAIESAKCRIYRVRANVGKSLEHQIKADNQAEIQQVTIDALEKQIPKEVVVVDYALGETEYRCPSCSLLVSSTYCEECGQKIDWGLDD